MTDFEFPAPPKGAIMEREEGRKWRTYCFFRIREGKKEWGIASGYDPGMAMLQVLGSHPAHYGVTYANVYLPEEEANHEWFMHPPTDPQNHKAMR